MEGHDEFPIALPRDEEALVVLRKEGESQFVEVQNGDHLCTPF